MKSPMNANDAQIMEKGRIDDRCVILNSFAARPSGDYAKEPACVRVRGIARGAPKLSAP